MLKPALGSFRAGVLNFSKVSVSHFLSVFGVTPSTQLLPVSTSTWRGTTQPSPTFWFSSEGPRLMKKVLNEETLIGQQIGVE